MSLYMALITNIWLQFLVALPLLCFSFRYRFRVRVAVLIIGKFFIEHVHDHLCSVFTCVYKVFRIGLFDLSWLHLKKLDKIRDITYFPSNLQVASWNDIQTFYRLDQTFPVRLAPKLTNSHIFLPPFSKMRVRNTYRNPFIVMNLYYEIWIN